MLLCTVADTSVTHSLCLLANAQKEANDCRVDVVSQLSPRPHCCWFVCVLLSVCYARNTRRRTHFSLTYYTASYNALLCNPPKRV